MKDEFSLRRVVMPFILHPSAFILVLACFSAKPPPAPPAAPQFTAVPSAAVDAMCLRLHDEGFASEQPVNVVTTTQPLVSQQTLEALSQMQFYKGRVNKQALEEAVKANEIRLPIGKGSPACAWRGIAADAPRSADTMMLELSTPFPLPFGHGGEGVLARFSLSGEAASWYWIPLVNRDGKWLAARAVSLATH